MSTLFELEDFTETRSDWQIVGDWGLCGLCGVKTSFNQGGTTTGAVCDSCAKVDRCGQRFDGLEHVSHWGVRHTAAEHEHLVLDQARRRARFLAARSHESTTGA